MDLLQLEGVGMTSKRTRERLINRLLDQGITNQEVLDVLANTPRHLFVDEALSHRAYEDTALPIGFGQTISQPYIVARMSELLIDRAESLDNVLEIGTGSGYQTAVLAQLVKNVWSVERIQALQKKARSRLSELGVRNVQYRHSDGSLGWPEDKQFDAILSAAAPRSIPKRLYDQLAPNGILIIPVGGETQALTLVRRNGDGDGDGDGDTFTTETYEDVKFVPLLSGTAQ
ncbi:MAG: protein-L-isoaspartate(D-aspartate) O-methyltransferase [Flavobacteriales bacterium]